MTKTLYDISWQVDEPTYREDKAISYSTISTYSRLGFKGLDRIFDKIESPSLTFGSGVDALVTGGQKEFNSKFIVAEFPKISDTLITIVKGIFELDNTKDELSQVPNNIILSVADRVGYSANWKADTRIAKIITECSSYYKLLKRAKDKTIISNDIYQDMLNCVNVLHSSDATKWFFDSDNPFDGINRFYQLKFKSTLNNIEYRCMADLLVCDTNAKIIYPIDLKTSSMPEYEFPQHFIDWNYSYQARLYWRIIRDNLDRDDYFKDFELADYKFVVVCKNTLVPLVWEFKDTKKYGDLTYNDIILKDPEEIGEELNYYLNKDTNRVVPIGIDKNGTNDIVEWLNNSK